MSKFWKLNNILLTERRKSLVKNIKYFELNANKNTIYQKFWDAAKTMLRGHL